MRPAFLNKTHLRFFSLLLLIAALASGCYSLPKAQSTNNDASWNELHDSLYESFWVDDFGNARSH